MQLFITYIIIGMAFGIAAYRAYKQMTGRSKGCNCGEKCNCRECKLHEKCGDAR